MDWQQKSMWYVPTKLDNRQSKMYKISDEVIKYIKNTKQNWRVELRTRGKSIPKGKIQRRNFQGDSLSPLLFVIEMMPLNHIFGKCTSGYKLDKSQEKINHLVYMDDIKWFKKWKRIGNTYTGSVDILSSYRDGIWHRNRCHVNKEKQKTIHDRRNRTTK